MTLALSPDQRRALAARLDLNPWTLTPQRVVERIEELKTRSRSFEESGDPTGVLRLDRSATTSTAGVTTTTGVGEAEIDAAVASGKIEPEDRSAWTKRFQDDAEFTRELLDALPDNSILADRAYAEDDRLRSLGDQFDTYLGIAPEDRVRDYEDAPLSESELLYQRLAEMTNAPDAP